MTFNLNTRLNNLEAEVEGIQVLVSSTIGDAPALLDTIQALANSISNDPNYSNTIVSDLALKLNIADFNTDIANYVCTLTNLTVDTGNLIVLTKSGNAISLNYTNLLVNLEHVGHEQFTDFDLKQLRQLHFKHDHRYQQSDYAH